MSSQASGEAWHLIRQGHFAGPATSHRLVVLALADRADILNAGWYEIRDLAIATGLSGGACRDSIQHLSHHPNRYMVYREGSRRGRYTYQLDLNWPKAAKLKQA